MFGFLFRTLPQKGIEFFVGSTLKNVLLVDFFLGYSDFPYFIKADISKFKNTTDNPSSTVTSPTAAYFWLKVSRVILINTRYFINHSQIWSILGNLFIFPSVSFTAVNWRWAMSAKGKTYGKISKCELGFNLLITMMMMMMIVKIWKINNLFRSKSCSHFCCVCLS